MLQHLISISVISVLIEAHKIGSLGEKKVEIKHFKHFIKVHITSAYNYQKITINENYRNETTQLLTWTASDFVLTFGLDSAGAIGFPRSVHSRSKTLKVLSSWPNSRYWNKNVCSHYCSHIFIYLLHIHLRVIVFLNKIRK